MGRDSDRVIRFLREIYQAHVSAREELGEEKAPDPGAGNARSRLWREQGAEQGQIPWLLRKARQKAQTLGLA